MKKQKFLLLVPFFLLMYSCEKDKWNKTVTVSLDSITKLQTTEIAVDSNTLQFEQVTVEVDYIEIKGVRLQGSNYHKTIEQDITFDFINGTLSDNISFDLPQGNYEKLSIQLGNNQSDENIVLQYKMVNSENQQEIVEDLANVNLTDEIIAGQSENQSDFLVKDGENWSLQLYLDETTLASGLESTNWNHNANNPNNPNYQEGYLDQVSELIKSNFNHTIKIKITQN